MLRKAEHPNVGSVGSVHKNKSRTFCARAEAVATQMRQAWPRDLAEQFKAVRDALGAQAGRSRRGRVDVRARPPRPRRRGAADAGLARPGARDRPRPLRAVTVSDQIESPLLIVMAGLDPWAFSPRT